MKGENQMYKEKKSWKEMKKVNGEEEWSEKKKFSKIKSGKNKKRKFSIHWKNGKRKDTMAGAH